MVLFSDTLGIGYSYRVTEVPTFLYIGSLQPT